MRRLAGALAALATLGLGACGNTDTASHMIVGNDLAITLERVRPYAWSEGWQLTLILRNNPECQRRHALKTTTANGLKVEVYSPQRGVFILRQAKRWYVAELQTCQFQAFKEAPPEPGDLVGTFQEKGGSFRFVDATTAESKAPIAQDG